MVTTARSKTSCLFAHSSGMVHTCKLGQQGLEMEGDHRRLPEAVVQGSVFLFSVGDDVDQILIIKIACDVRGKGCEHLVDLRARITGYRDAQNLSGQGRPGIMGRMPQARPIPVTAVTRT